MVYYFSIIEDTLLRVKCRRLGTIDNNSFSVAQYSKLWMFEGIRYCATGKELMSTVPNLRHFPTFPIKAKGRIKKKQLSHSFPNLDDISVQTQSFQYFPLSTSQPIIQPVIEVMDHQTNVIGPNSDCIICPLTFWTIFIFKLLLLSFSMVL